nr:calcium-binding protein [uncultured Cohaesibacter sp.]
MVFGDDDPNDGFYYTPATETGAYTYFGTAEADLGYDLYSVFWDYNGEIYILNFIGTDIDWVESGPDEIAGTVYGIELRHTDPANMTVLGATESDFDWYVSGLSLDLTEIYAAMETSDISDDAFIFNAINSVINTVSYGTAASDTLQGTDEADRIFGRAGNDVISGGGGNDVLNGEAGNDHIYGQAGADKLYGGLGNDFLSGGAGNDKLYGNLGNDRLFGGQGNDYLDGGAGADDMTGAAGNDVYIVDNGNDKAVELAGQGTDLVKSSVTFSLQTNGQQVENLTLTGNAAINGTGNGLGNVVNGNMSGNILNGLAGNDKLFGKGGADTINGGNGNDALHGGNGNDLLRGANGNDILNGNAGADNLNGGLGNDQLNGGVGNDVLNGMAGSDRLVGAAGADRMYGAAGADSFIGGLGADSMYAGNDNAVDSFIFNSVNDSKAGLAHDKIYLFDSGEDVLDLSHIDANTSVAGNQTFAFAGTQAAAHSVWLEADGSDLLVFADNNGDAVADFELQLMDKASVVAGDFLL